MIVGVYFSSNGSRSEMSELETDTGLKPEGAILLPREKWAVQISCNRAPLGDNILDNFNFFP